MYAPADDEVSPEATRIRVDNGTGIAIGLAAIAVVFLGIAPGLVENFSRDATQVVQCSTATTAVPKTSCGSTKP